MSHILIAGAPKASVLAPGGPVGPIPSRLEINDFIKKDDHFSLYIQALNALFKTPDSDPLSYYQISGIHGMPFVSWNGSPGGDGGYCSHRSVLFPTWHRPYLALLEQTIQKKAAEIANTYTVDKVRFQQAAVELRQPYWDWAEKAIPPDEVISKKQVTITKPDGSKGPVDNPLLGYTFPTQKEGIFPQPFSHWKSTVRTPTNSGPAATTNINELKEALEDAEPELTRDTLALLTLVHTWPLFSNRATSSGGFTNSLEAIHDSIHVYVGGQNGGHMGDPAVAAFDPIFYLHHTNVDRLFSLWAALNPGVGVSDMQKNGATLTATTALLPFWNAPNAMWQSKPVVASSNTFNYTYPEFVGFETASPDKLADHVLEQVNKLYGDPMVNSAAVPPPPAPAAPAPVEKPAVPAPPPAPVEKPAAPAPPPAAPAPKPEEPSPPSAPAAPTPKPAEPKPVEDVVIPKPTAPAPEVPAPPPPHQQPLEKPPAPGPTPVHPPAPAPAHPTPIRKPTTAVSGTKWTARVRCNHHDLQGSFSIFLFLGDVPADSKRWRRAPTYVGADDVFLMGEETKKHCDNCKGSDAPAPGPLISYVEGYIHLNDALKKANLPSLESDVVAPYLQKNLHWRVKRINGEVVWLNSLEVVVIQTSLERPRGSLFPVAGQPKKLNDVTHGRSGGARAPSA